MIIEFCNYTVRKFIFIKRTFSVISITEGNQEELIKIIDRSRSFEDCETIYLCTKTKENYYKITTIIKPTKRKVSIKDTIKIVLRFIVDKSLISEGDFVLNIDNKEEEIKNKDGNLPNFKLNNKKIKMLKPKRVTSGQMKSGIRQIKKQ